LAILSTQSSAKVDSCGIVYFRWTLTESAATIGAGSESIRC